MATQRHGRTGMFQGVSRTPSKRQAAGSRSPLAALAGATYTWDLASDALTWGLGACEVLGLSSRDLPRTGRAFAQLVEPASGLSRQDALALGDGSGGAYDTRYALRFDPDCVVMVQDAGRWQPETDGCPAFARGHLRLDAAASTPDLLPAAIRARSSLLVAIQEGINEALNVSHTCTLIAGALMGEEVSMAEIGRRLRPMMRRHDHFAATGPGSFALTLACCPAQEAVSAMRRVAGLLGDHAGPIRLGAACAPDHTFKAVKLLRFAELALERATDRGEAALLYNPRHHAPQPAPDKAPFDLVAALNDRRLTLACQKVVDAQSRAPALTQTYAALPSPQGNLIPLWALPALDEANLALLVDARMLELGTDHLARDPQARLALPVSIRTLQDPEWLPTLAAHLGARPGIESRLLVEVPEAALAEGGAGWGRLNAMKALGIGLTLTGFGTGHIRLDQLKNLPFDLLKIDGVFIQTLKRSTDDRLYVRTLVDKAQHLGIATLAEWVDDEHTARLLASWGVDYLQGALFGEPEPLRRPLTLQQMLKAARA